MDNLDKVYTLFDRLVERDKVSTKRIAKYQAAIILLAFAVAGLVAYIIF